MKSCLIVVDYQNDFVSGALGFAKSVELEKRIAEKIKRYRDSGDVVMFTLDTHRDDYLDTQEGRNLPVAHCIGGTRGHRLYGMIEGLACETDYKFYKNTFGSDALYAHLRQTPYKSIELAGVVSNICVIANNG
jgi:nicotinamidase-related amidase